MIISSLTNNQIYDNSTNNFNINKEKNDTFESLISSKKTSTTTTTPVINEKEAIVYKSSTQSLYEDIISLLKTGFTVGELKAFEERLKEILKMKKDKDSGKKITLKDIEAALEKLKMEMLEAQKNRMGEVVKKASNSTISSSNSTSNFNTTIENITNMLQEIKTSSKNTNTNDQDEENNEAYEKLKLILKMS